MAPNIIITEAVEIFFGNSFRMYHSNVVLFITLKVVHKSFQQMSAPLLWKIDTATLSRFSLMIESGHNKMETDWNEFKRKHNLKYRVAKLYEIF